MSIPDFDNLPPVEGMPKGCAWGVFDKDGQKDLLGTLNLLTPSVVAAAAAEVKEGVSISLNWPLNAVKIPIPGRKAPVHTVHSLSSSGLAPPECHGWDDELSFNTQSSSQWDSLVHMQHQASGLSYNGAKATHKELAGTGQATTTASGESALSMLPTINHWHSRGGLVGRGVLIDFKGYMDAQPRLEGHGEAQPYHCLDGYRITVQDVEKVARYQNLAFKRGDILIIRTGCTEMLENPTAADLDKMAHMKLSGLHGCEETARWVWNQHFSAVAGDSSSFEAYPPLKPDGSEGTASDLVLHQYFLALFGLPIGELWDLKQLAAHCRRTGKYSFMLTSAPLNHPGLVASPPNALAIF
ncbi:hypothetical protein BD289DRAFT_372180 [Coniella lustricola]|uniref:Cyclase-domain-containing protein n=1 Tax=Coniella lustricola TaxID=2025994 RepID=A0A2T3A2Q1_9PEZI|nr:hypothetical protein BD289DRAFT_372180 [Coniella lustricola]